MGIGPTALKCYDDLAFERIIYPGQSICELGSQDFVPENHKLSIYEHFDIVAPIWAPRTGREFYSTLQLGKYDCIDLDGHHGALMLDLNVATWDQVGLTYDIVTNHGTTEHVFNQYNCFMLIHDLTKVGGLMIHVLPHMGPPSKGYESHGLFLYTTNFFTDLARANKYEMLKHYTTPDGYGGMLVAVLRKNRDEKFVTPFQEIYRDWLSSTYPYTYA
jgi:hypothetical protein